MAGNDGMDSAFVVATEEFLLEYEESIGLSDVQPHGPLIRVRGKSAPPSRACRTPTDRSRVKAADRRERYRKKLQNERETLKQQEQELSIELTSLQEAHAKAKEEQKKANTLALSAWRVTAARQKEKRQETEERQRQLKAIIADRAQLIRQMNALLLQPVMDKPLKSLNAVDEANSALLFKNSIGELDSLHARTADVMAGVEFKHWSPEEFALTRSWNQSKTLLEGGDATVLPFAFEQTWLAISVLLLSDTSGSLYTGEIDDPENTTAMTYNLPGMSFIVYSVVRRYVEDERVVFVWRVLTEGQGEFDSLYANEHSWLVLRPSTDEAGRPTTTLESYTRLQPSGLDGQVCSGSRGDRFIESLAQADEDGMKDVHQALWRLLVDDPDHDLDVLEQKL
ncbi:Sugar transport protein 10 [Phytophthora cinnamomi]|uniref:Sugar transport protein 10 n=1 Tax=Phytophthora cinnamomi TaxID=4785 RepID=UPI002A2FF306|nr:Sugar transport protein 10 [Phytophthora cinnamomi]KAJ8574916.1 hypothetical protein ON010_g4298 [Phytophthora cinnamomi]